MMKEKYQISSRKKLRTSNKHSAISKVSKATNNKKATSSKKINLKPTRLLRYVVDSADDHDEISEESSSSESEEDESELKAASEKKRKLNLTTSIVKTAQV